MLNSQASRSHRNERALFLFLSPAEGPRNRRNLQTVRFNSTSITTQHQHQDQDQNQHHVKSPKPRRRWSRSKVQLAQAWASWKRTKRTVTFVIRSENDLSWKMVRSFYFTTKQSSMEPPITSFCGGHPLYPQVKPPPGMSVGWKRKSMSPDPEASVGVPFCLFSQVQPFHGFPFCLLVSKNIINKKKRKIMNPPGFEPLACTIACGCSIDCTIETVYKAS